jgi:hypothetical protein
MSHQPSKCECAHCRLREISNENTLNELRWLEEKKKELIKKNRQFTEQLIADCIKARTHVTT